MKLGRVSDRLQMPFGGMKAAGARTVRRQYGNRCSYRIAQDYLRDRARSSLQSLRHDMKALNLVLLVALMGCSESADPEPGLYYTDQTMHDFMNKVMQPAAEAVWDKTGYLTNEDGFQSMFPQNAEEWQEAESDSLLVAELSNVLSIPGRRVAERDWDAAVEGVRMTSLAIADAAAKQNEDDFMKFALALNNACQSCHIKYDRPAQQ